MANASLFYTYAKAKIARGEIDLEGAGSDVRIALVGASSTCDTEPNAQTISGFTTLDECTATDYVRKSLDSEIVNVDTGNLRGEFDATDVTWTALGGAANFTIQGILVYKFVATDADHVPIAYVHLASTLTTNGGDVVITWNAEGILQF